MFGLPESILLWVLSMPWESVWFKEGMDSISNVANKDNRVGFIKRASTLPILKAEKHFLHRIWMKIKMSRKIVLNSSRKLF